ncbi:MAG: hypothetical protein ACFFCP_13670 [Promethearchaeota archaeon]
MNEYSFRRILLTVTDPDDTGTGNGSRNPLITVLAVFVGSIIACGITMQLLPGSTDILYHVAWAGFHILYIGALWVLYRALVRRNQAALEAF